MDWRSTVAVGAGLGLAACAGERGLDDKHLPAAVRGLVPGSATEAEVRAAWPEAGPPTRDRTAGTATACRVATSTAAARGPAMAS